MQNLNNSTEKLVPFLNDRHDERFDSAPDINYYDGKLCPKDWTFCKWRGNLELKMICWVKKFGRGHVSIRKDGSVTYSFGANSEYSFSGGFFATEEPQLDIHTIQKRLDYIVPKYLQDCTNYRFLREESKRMFP